MKEIHISDCTHRVAALAANILSAEDRQHHESGYAHMGALLTDAILQAGVNYRTVVVPRIHSVLQRFPDATTTIAFQEILINFGSASVLQWRHPEKPRRLSKLTAFLIDNGVFTRNAFRSWIAVSTNSNQLITLPGIGPKTIDYLKKLCGLDAVAVDRHIRAFVSRAGVFGADYAEVRLIVERAADLLSISRSALDWAIWKYESGQKVAFGGCERSRSDAT